MVRVLACVMSRMLHELEVNTHWTNGKSDNVDFKNKGKQLESVQSYQGGNIESAAALRGHESGGGHASDARDNVASDKSTTRTS